MSIAPIEVLQTNRDAAEYSLVEHLRNGELVLILGAGSSFDLGMPSWNDLVVECLSQANKKDLAEQVDERTPAEKLQQLMNEIEPKEGGRPEEFQTYRELIGKSLYQEGRDFRQKIVGKPLWIAIGALLMGSRRGTINEVITYNFDDVLEWYLDVHGFTSQTITALPTLRRDVDVTVAHPYGFIPSREGRQPSDFIVLSARSFERHIGRTESAWREYFRRALLDRVGLFVGFSGNDYVFRAIARAVDDDLKQERPVGYWMRGPMDYEGDKDLSDEQKNMKRQEADRQLHDSGFVTLRFESYSEWPSFLLGICEEAAKRDDGR